MKIVLLFSPDANQRALAHRIAEVAPIAAIITCRPDPQPNRTAHAKLARLARGLVGLPLRKAWLGMLGRYERDYPEFPVEPLLLVRDINDPAIATAIREIAPDLVIVSGTNLLKQPLIDLISETGKIMNLHTGISPYVRGAPNCTNWCLATGRFDLIGNTVMWIDAGIDSGNLIATERTPLDGSESLTELHIKVMDHAHSLLIRCIRRFIAGKPLPNVAQSELGPGKLFLNRQWNALAAAQAITNFHLFFAKQASGRAEECRLIAPEARD